MPRWILKRWELRRAGSGRSQDRCRRRRPPCLNAQVADRLLLLDRFEPFLSASLTIPITFLALQSVPRAAPMTLPLASTFAGLALTSHLLLLRLPTVQSLGATVTLF